MTRRKVSSWLHVVVSISFTLLLVAPSLAQDEAKWQAALQEAGKARQAGKLEEVELQLKTALAEAELFGPLDQHLVLSLDALGAFYYEKGDYAQAQPVFARMLDIRERTLGSRHPLVATVLNNTAVVEALAGMKAEAEAHSKRALQISEQIAEGFSGITALVAGGNHTCALVGGGQVYCWGGNLDGQLGLPSPASTAYPVQVPQVSNAISIAAGAAFSCALLTDHTVTCWGANSSGQTGAAVAPTSAPNKLAGIAKAQAIAAGGEHACALLEGGTVKCWGNNQKGQLGNGASANASAPVEVAGIKGATAIAAGVNHSCAAVQGGVSCWGAFVAEPSAAATPVRVPGLSGTVQSLGTGANYGCALLSDKKLSCWWEAKPPAGAEVKPSTLTNAEVIQSLGEVQSLAAGYAHTCVVLMDGSARCWGNNREGQLGNGQTQSTMAPVAVKKLASATSLAAGLAHTCAILADKTAACWGSDSYGAPSGVVFSVKSHEPVPVGRDESTLLASIRNLADIYRALKRFGEAEPLYQRALQMVEKERGPEDERLAPVLNAYARMLQEAGRTEEAAKAEERAQFVLNKPVLTDVPLQPTTPK